jgi:hypothetical protein
MRKKNETTFINNLWCRKRSINKYKYFCGFDMSKTEFINWLYENGFARLYMSYKENDYRKDLAPSVNRLDDYKPYSKENIELVTWEENNIKGRQSPKTRERVYQKLGDIAKKLFERPVIKKDLDGKILATYKSVTEAAQMNKTNFSNISRVCRGVKKTHHGYIWQYMSQLDPKKAYIK